MKRSGCKFGSAACFGALWLLTSILTAAPPPASSSPTEWPMFRGGPSLLGVAPVTLPKELALSWKWKTQGQVKSSAAIVGGRVFIGSDDGNIYALDLRNGAKLWAYKTGGPVESSP